MVFKCGWRLVGAETNVRAYNNPRFWTVARPDIDLHAHYFCVFCRLAQLFFIEIKCSALNLKYLSQYLNGFGCPLLVPLNFQNLIFGLLYSYWHIIIIAPLFPTLKLFFVKNIHLARRVLFPKI